MPTECLWVISNVHLNILPSSRNNVHSLQKIAMTSSLVMLLVAMRFAASLAASWSIGETSLNWPAALDPRFE